MQITNHDIQERIEWLNATFDSARLSQEAVANATGIHQSQISRILSGQVKRLSKNVISLCKYADDLHNKHKSPKRIPSVLHHALLNTWDGSAEHAEAIAKVILSLNGMSVKHAD